jgi:hypothetical protein
MSLNNFALILLAVLIGACVVLAIQFALKQRAKHSQPKTGFLGKALMQFSVAMVLITGIVGAYFLSTGKIEIVSQANKEVKTEINYQILSQENNKVTVQFQAVPSIGGKEWGNENDTFDIFWNIRPDDATEAKGQTNIDYFETSVSKSKPSKFTKVMLKGTYKVKLVVSYNGESFEKQSTIKI